LKLAGLTLPPTLADAVRASRTHLIAATVFSSLLNLLMLAPAIYMLQVYDRVLPTGGELTLLFVTLALAAALVTLALLDVIRGRLLVRAGARLDALLSPRLLRRALSRGDGPSVQAMRDLDNVRQAVSSPATAALMDLPWVPIFVVVCFLLHFWVGVLAIASMVLLVMVALRNQKVTSEAVGQASQTMAASHAAEQGAAVHAGTLRGLGMVGAVVNRQMAQRGGAIATLVAAGFKGSRYSALSRFLRLFVQSAALGLGVLLAIEGRISAGAIIASSILIGRALQPIDALTGGWSSLSSARAALARLAEALGSDAGARVYTALPSPTGQLSVENVAVRGSDGRAALAGVSFEASPGEILGMVGPTGSGKSTLARVIAGAMMPEIGAVRIDGAHQSDWDPDVLGRFIGYMPQEPSLLQGSIKDNISRFDVWRDGGAVDLDEQVIAAAKAAGVHDLIVRLPGGYDMQLGPLGAGLSSGQAQRIALARALYGGPALLILDEPNAFLDGEGEDALMRALLAAKGRGATVLLIAHRRSILKCADRLLVLDAGRPKLLGPAPDVMARLALPSPETAE
jgi:PrtD family type I secretion system ABC transporter